MSRFNFFKRRFKKKNCFVLTRKLSPTKIHLHLVVGSVIFVTSLLLTYGSLYDLKELKTFPVLGGMIALGVDVLMLGILGKSGALTTVISFHDLEFEINAERTYTLNKELKEVTIKENSILIKDKYGLVDFNNMEITEVQAEQIKDEFHQLQNRILEYKKVKARQKQNVLNVLIKK